MNDITSFAQNLKVWSRRMDVDNLGHKAGEIACQFKGNLGRRAAIKAVAAEWFFAHGAPRQLCWNLAEVASIDVYHGVYYPEEPSPAIGLDEGDLRNPFAMVLIEQFCQQAREAYRQEKAGIHGSVGKALKSTSETWDD